MSYFSRTKVENWSLEAALRFYEDLAKESGNTPLQLVTEQLTKLSDSSNTLGNQRATAANLLNTLTDGTMAKIGNVTYGVQAIGVAGNCEIHQSFLTDHQQQHQHEDETSAEVEQQSQQEAEGDGRQPRRHKLDDISVDFKVPRNHDRYVVNGVDISMMFYSFQLHIKDLIKNNRLCVETHVHHILAVSSILLIKPKCLDDDLKQFINLSSTNLVVNDLRQRMGLGQIFIQC